MNFVQISDVHFDAPFKIITDRANLGTERRIEQREAFRKAINFIKNNNVEFLFITGDLYEQEYIRKSTIDFINGLFKEIKDTKIFIIPGNHDPYIKDSYYATYDWANNVKIFSNKLEKIEENGVCIYGYGFDNYEMIQEKIDYIERLDKNKINIFLSHGDVYNKSKYNYMDIKKLKLLGFDYLGIGHIHKRDEVYPGSLISLGFDELGQHGFIYGKIERKTLTKQFIVADSKEFKIKELNVTEITSMEELIEKINEENIEENILYEIILVGYRKFEIKIDMKLIKKDIIKVKDNTQFKVEFKENNNTLKGIFIKMLNIELSEGKISKAKYEKILELGINALEKNK